MHRIWLAFDFVGVISLASSDIFTHPSGFLQWPQENNEIALTWSLKDVVSINCPATKKSQNNCISGPLSKVTKGKHFILHEKHGEDSQ